MNCDVPANGVVTTLVRYFILVRVFDGDADAWLYFLRGEKAAWARDDREFLLWLKAEISSDPDSWNRIRLAVDDFESAINNVPHPRVN